MPRNAAIEASLSERIRAPGLDLWALRAPEEARRTRDAIDVMIAHAWDPRRGPHDESVAAERLLTQRIGYRIGRLRFYWFEDPDAHANERSTYLAEIETELQQGFDRWLAAQVPEDEYATGDVEALLRQWFERDRTPTEGEDRRFIAKEMSRAGYRRLLEVTSLNGLVEASHLSRVLAGASDPVQSTLTRILIEEYGGGKLHRKHSTFFAAMLEAMGLSSRPEAYFDRVPWELLAVIQHGIHLTELKRNFLRFCGAFTYTETSTPVSFAAHAEAATRLGLGDGRSDYWSLHIREDERHGAWMLDEVALPLVRRFPAHARELVRGYAEQRFVESLAGRAIARECRRAEQTEGAEGR